MNAIHQNLDTASQAWDVPVSALGPSRTAVVEGTFRVTHYDGLRRGRSGTHELAEGTLTYGAPGGRSAPGVRVVKNVQIAMNVATPRDPHGLPREMPLAPGDTLQVRGELVPSSETHSRSPDGTPEPVLHFTHAPEGYVRIAGVTFQ